MIIQPSFNVLLVLLLMLSESLADWSSSVTQGPMGVDYVPTEEEIRVFKECNHESFWYRCKFIFCPHHLTSIAVGHNDDLKAAVIMSLLRRKNPEHEDSPQDLLVP